jgi:hypothetical protein
LDKDGGGWSDDNVAKFEKELLQALELQDVEDQAKLIIPQVDILRTVDPIQ